MARYIAPIARYPFNLQARSTRDFTIYSAFKRSRAILSQPRWQHIIPTRTSHSATQIINKSQQTSPHLLSSSALEWRVNQAGSWFICLPKVSLHAPKQKGQRWSKARNSKAIQSIKH